MVQAGSPSRTALPAQHTAGFGDDHRALSREADNQLMRPDPTRALVQLGVDSLEVEGRTHGARVRARAASHVQRVGAITVVPVGPALNEAAFLGKELAKAHPPAVEQDAGAIKLWRRLEGLTV